MKMWPSAHDFFDDLAANVRQPEVASGIPVRKLLVIEPEQLNVRHQAARSHEPLLEARIQSFELAYRMQMEAAEAFDLQREPQHVRDLYGDTVHGRQTLIARRLLAEEGTSLKLSVSVTTRPMRPGEIDGKDYFFHRSGLEPSLDFDQLAGGEWVTFEIESSPKGPRATRVRSAP